MLNRLGSMARGASRRLAMAPLRLLAPGQRAQAVELVSNRMIATTPVPGGALRFFAPSPLLQDRAASVLTKEPDMIRWIDGIGRGAVLWDIGANVGAFTLYAAVRAGCTVLSFEPSAANFFVLSRNIQLNRLHHRVTAYCVALSGRTELGVLNLASAGLGTALSQFGSAGTMSRYSGGESEPIVQGMVGFTVDDFVARFQPPFPTHIKLDVDGLEWPILQSAVHTLRDPRLRAVMVELSLSDRGERQRAISFLEAAGLALVSQGDPQGTDLENAANHLFERQGG